MKLLVLQGNVKFLSLVNSAPTITRMHSYLKKIHETCNDQTSNRFIILTRWSYIFKLVIQIFITTIAITFITLLAYPLVWYLLTGEVETTLPIMLPFVDETTTKGYVICVTTQSFWVLIAGFGFLTADLTYGILTLYAWPLVDLFCDHIEGMNVALRMNRKLGETNEMKEYFYNMVQLHRDVIL